MTHLQKLIATSATVVTDLTRSQTTVPADSVEAKWDNRPTWDNLPARPWNNQATWHNWNQQ